MRIISKFKDYYDCMQGYYRDDMVYIRNKNEEKIEGSEYRQEYEYFGSRYHHLNKLINNWMYRFINIWFCGKSYKVYEIFKDRPSDDKRGQFCYHPDDFDKYFPNEAKELRKHFGHKPTNHALPWYERPLNTDASIDEIMVKRKTPIIVNYPKKIVYDACLKDVNFQRMFPPALAYQELMMYLGSVLAAPEKPIPVIDDVTMAEAKGFNKYSFRKDKSK